MKNVADIYALSPMQELMLLHALTANSADDVLFNQIVYRLRGSLDAAALHQAWQHLVDRHPAFRTLFVWQKAKEPVQVVREQAALPWTEHDWREAPPAQQEACLAELLEEDRLAGFDLLRPPLQRIILIRRADDDYWMIWSCHHLIIDRWCIGIAFDELAAAYEAYARGASPALPPAPRYLEYIAWLAAQDQAAAASFWRESLRDLQARPLPLAPAPKDQAPLLRTTEIVLPAATTESLRRFALDHDLTTGTLVPAAWALVLGAATRTQDVLMGQTVSGRPAEVPGVNATIGCFINNVPLRVQLDPTMAVISWLQALQDRQLSLQAYEYASPAQIQAWTGAQQTGPLFDSLVLVQAPVQHGWPAGLQLDLERGGLQTGYPLSLDALHDNGELHLTLTYDRHRVPGELVAQMAASLERVLLAMPANEDTQLQALQSAARLDWQPAVEKVGANPPVSLPGAQSYTPPRNQTELTLAHMWAGMLQLPQVGIHDNFFDLGGQSLSATLLISRIRDRFGVDLSLRVLIEEATIAHLAAEIEQAAPALEHPVLLPLNRNGARPPFFFAHGMFGVVSYLANLGPLLEADQPVYGLEAIGLQPDREPDRHLEEMAARSVEAMRTVQAHGPYYVGGFCFGGVLAYEIARQLEEAGEPIALLAIIEGSAPEQYHHQVPLVHPQRLQVFRQTLPFWMRGYEEHGGWQWRERFRHVLQLGNRQNHGGRRELDIELDNAGDINTLRPPVQKELRIINDRAFDSYHPQPYGGRVTFFRASSIRVGHAVAADFDPLRGWGTLAQGGVDLRFVPGTHTGILERPYVVGLAAELTRAIHEAAAREAAAPSLVSR